MDLGQAEGFFPNPYWIVLFVFGQCIKRGGWWQAIGHQHTSADFPIIEVMIEFLCGKKLPEDWQGTGASTAIDAAAQKEPNFAVFEGIQIYQFPSR